VKTILAVFGVVPLVLLLSAIDQPAPPPSVVGEAALTTAKDAFNASRWQDALDAALKVLEQQSENVDALYIAGASERQLNLLDAAEAHLKTLTGLAPRYPFAHHRLGFVEFLQAEALARDGDQAAARAKYSASAEAFAKELERDPTEIVSASSESIALARAGRIEESVKAHEAWIALAPDKNDAVVSLAATYALADRSTEAMTSLDRLPQKDAKSKIDASTAVANVFIEKKDWGSAVPFLKQPVAIDPQSAHARAVLTATYARALEYDDAVSSLKVLCAMEPAPDVAGIASDAIRATIGDGKTSVSAPGVEPPKALQIPRPRYPRGQDSSVEVEILILARVAPPGKLVDTIMVPNRIWKDLRASGFEEQALAAVKRGKFVSGTKNGEPATLWTAVPVEFSRH